MQLKQRITFLIRKIRKIPNWFFILGASLLALLISYLLFFWDRPVQFSYTEKSTCIQQITFLPSMSSLTNSDLGFIVENKDIIKIYNIPIASSQTCFSAKQAPKVGSSKISISLFGSWFAKKTYIINTLRPPETRLEGFSSPIPVIKSLVIQLSDSDVVFGYKLAIDGKVANCPMKNSSIYCDVKSLQLLQGKDYEVKLIRLFGEKEISILFDKNITTLSATTVTGASISQNRIIYNKPKTFTFDFDKDIIKSNITLEKIEGDKRIPASVVLSFKDKQASVIVKDDLTRDSTYEFSISELEAMDGSTLVEPYKLDFKTSDGPSVASVNVSTVGLPLSQTIVLTFDQPIVEDQDITKWVITSGIPTSISRSKNQVYIRYDNAPVCAGLNINIKPGLASDNGVIQNDSWGFSTRTICHATVTIGYSVLGRPILEYIFGSGGTIVLFTGGMHGSEPSGSYILHDWIAYLENNATKIPADKKIIVVPDVNPDGLAKLSRYNANNVNIDRNFSSTNWAADIDTGGGTMVGGGGGSPMSEPETKALADLTISLRPRLEVSFHAKGNLVGANQYGDSVRIANQYASNVGYKSMIGQAEETMGYLITGEYEDWEGEQGISAILIELPTSTGRHFNAHQSTLWWIVNL